MLSVTDNRELTTCAKSASETCRRTWQILEAFQKTPRRRRKSQFLCDKQGDPRQKRPRDGSRADEMRHGHAHETRSRP